MQEDSKKEFGKLRSFFWPIHAFELKKFLPLFFMFFLISFNYNALRAYKDAMVITAKNSGAEAVPFIKVWAILPCALLLTFFFTRIASKYSRERVFYTITGMFLAFFFIFAFFLFPYQEYLHPHGAANFLESVLPAGFKGLIALFRNWTFTLFYVASELWGTAILSVLFWGFANEVTSVHEAKRFYGLLSIGANIGSIISGQVAVFLSGNLFFHMIPYGKTSWDQSVFFVTCLILLSGFITIALFRWVNLRVIRPVEAVLEEPPKVKEKSSLRKDFAYLAKSKYLLCIAAIVLTYNIAVNLIEVVWKNQIKQAYSDPNLYNAYMGEVMTLMGIIATLTGIFVTGNLIRKFSWTFTALVAPIIVLITGVAFFAFCIYQNQSFTWIAAFFGSTPLLMSVGLGAIQNSLTRASKYTLFDATKEMAFIPLSNESKFKGKAAIDGVGSRLGKSGGSIIHQSLLFLFATVSSSTPYVAIIFLGVIVVWIAAVVSLGKQFDQLVGKKGSVPIQAYTAGR